MKTVVIKTLVTTVAILCIVAGTANAFPLSNTLGPSQNVAGSSNCHPTQNFTYTVQFDTALGGHWSLTGRSHLNRDGTYTDSFRGTVSDTSFQGTFSRNDFDWVADSYYLCNGSHAYIYCTSFSITISDGSITGFATYTP